MESTEEATSALLGRVLADGDDKDSGEEAARILSRHVHADPKGLLSASALEDLGRLPEAEGVEVDRLGIWIDPIGK